MKRFVTLLKDWRTYKKAIIAEIAVIAAWAAPSLADGHISLAEWLALIPVVLTGPGVYVTSNAPPSQG